MTQRGPLRRIPWIAVLVVAGLAAYLPGLRGRYYSDDFNYVNDPPPHPLYFFSHPNLHIGKMYRPFESTFHAVLQRHIGLETLPVHLFALTMHVSLAWLVFRAGRWLGFSNLEASLSSLFMLLSQANALAVLSNDTLSQVGSALFGSVSVGLLYRARTVGGEPGAGRGGRVALVAASAACLVCALFWKENGLSYVPILAGVAAATGAGRGGHPASDKSCLGYWAGLVALAAAYLVLRSAAGVAPPAAGADNGYQFHLGLNVVKNVGMFLVAGLLPLSSAAVFTALAARDAVTLGVAGAGVVAFVGFVAFGLWRNGRARTMALLGFCGLACLFPAALLNHVSELYVYNAMPFLSLIVGAGLGGAWSRAAGHPAASRAAAAAVALLFAAHVTSVWHKAFLMRENGLTASRILNQIAPHAAKIPEGGKLVLVNPPGGPAEYSVYLVRGFNVLKYATHGFHRAVGRKDFKVWIVEPSELRDVPDLDHSVVLELTGDRKGIALTPWSPGRGHVVGDYRRD